jgi:Pyruvate/2-oxoacid:ferredoxin oxidoreductase gamma subunit
MAEEFGVPKAANTMMLAALAKLGLTGLSRDSLEKALVASFAKKPALGEKNRGLFHDAMAKMK